MEFVELDGLPGRPDGGRRLPGACAVATRCCRSRFARRLPAPGDGEPGERPRGRRRAGDLRDCRCARSSRRTTTSWQRSTGSAGRTRRSTSWRPRSRRRARRLVDVDLSKIGDSSRTTRPIVRFVNLLVTQAIQDRASDIHIEPAENDLLVRYRIDGVLHEMQRAPKHIQPGVISRLKIMCDIDIAERRKPQDGRMSVDAQRPQDRPPRRDPAHRVGREDRHANPRQLHRDPRPARAVLPRRQLRGATRARTPSPTA